MTDKNRRIWLERVTAPVIAESHIRQFRQAIYPLAGGYMPGGHRLDMEYDEACDVVAAFHHRVQVDGGPLVTDQQADKGRRWIETQGRRLGIPEEYRHGITHFRFEAITVYDRDDRWGKIDTAPVYRAFYADGRQMRYHATPWTASAYGRKGDPERLTFHADYREAAA